MSERPAKQAGVWLHERGLSPQQQAAISADLLSSGQADDHGAHVLLWTGSRLGALADFQRLCMAQEASNETNAQAKKSLEAIAEHAKALAELTGNLAPRARAHYISEVFGQGLTGRHLAGQWEAERFTELWGLACAAAARITPAPGRKASLGLSVGLCADIAAELARYRLAPKQAGPFLRICAVVFEAAGIPALPRDAVRELQRKRGK